MSTEDQDRAEAYEAIDTAFATHMDGWVVEGDDHLSTLILDALAPTLAAVRREAAADAYRAASAHAFKMATVHEKLGSEVYGGGAGRLEHYAQARQARIEARWLASAAQNVIEEGWEHTCAAEFPATREDPGHGCEDPVEHDGGYCARHEPEDDHDPRDAR